MVHLDTVWRDELALPDGRLCKTLRLRELRTGLEAIGIECDPSTGKQDLIDLYAKRINAIPTTPPRIYTPKPLLRTASYEDKAVEAILEKDRQREADALRPRPSRGVSASLRDWK